MAKREQVIGYFNAIGHRYDLADNLMSMGLHFLWRRICLRNLNVKPGCKVLDLCGGTGVFARLISRRGGIPVVCDFSRPMMEAGRNKTTPAGKYNDITWVQGDAESLCFSEGAFDAVIIGFGVRNLVNIQSGVEEMFRVLSPGGVLIIMEFSVPQSPWVNCLYHWYSYRAMPWLGRLITGEAAPFRYLADSIRSFHSPESLCYLLEKTGFSQVIFKRLSNGIVTLHSGIKKIENKGYI